MNVVFGTGPTFRGFSPAEDFALSLLAAQTISSTVGSAGTLRDALTVTVSGAYVDSVYSVQFQDSTDNPGTVVSNLTPSLATFVGSQKAVWAGSPTGGLGTAKVQGSHPLYGTRVVSLPVSRIAQASTTAFTAYATGSAAADLSSFIDTAISGVTATPANCARFSNLKASTRNATRWWASIVDDTSISRDLGQEFGCLISQRHALGAAHAGVCAIGSQMGWVGSDGVVYVGTAATQATVAGTDILVVYFRDATTQEIAAYNTRTGQTAATAALSASFSSGNKVKPMALMPAATWASSNCSLPLSQAVAALPSSSYVPVFHFTRNNSVGIWEASQAPRSVPYTNGVTFPNELGITQSFFDGRAPFSAYANVGGSASGDMTFTAIPVGTTLATNNASLGAGYPILLGTTHGLGAGTFDLPWTPLYLSGIQTAMQSTAQTAGDAGYASYAPTLISLTGYTSY